MAYQMYPQYQQYQQNQNTFVCVRNEMEARNYPIAFGTSITFKDETAPYIYTKTMGFSQLDTPRFEKFRIVREDVTQPETTNVSSDDLNERIEQMRAEIEALKKAVFKKKTKEVADDDSE